MGKFGGNFVPETLKPIEDLEILFNKLKKDKKFINERDKYFKNWIGAPTRFIKLEKILLNMWVELKFGLKLYQMQTVEHIKFTMQLFIVCLQNVLEKNYMWRHRAGYAGKMLSMAAKFGLKCKIFMGAKDIKRQQPNVKAMKKNGAEGIPVYSGSQN